MLLTLCTERRHQTTSCGKSVLIDRSNRLVEHRGMKDCTNCNTVNDIHLQVGYVHMWWISSWSAWQHGYRALYEIWESYTCSLMWKSFKKWENNLSELLALSPADRYNGLTFYFLFLWLLKVLTHAHISSCCSGSYNKYYNYV